MAKVDRYNGNLAIVVLFEDEIRTAALALHELNRVSRDAPTDHDAVGRAAQTAMDACWAAIYHAGLIENEKAHLTIANKRLIQSKS
jgi:hypothetical protein